MKKLLLIILLIVVDLQSTVMGVKISDAGQYFSIIGTVILLCKI